MNGYLLVVPGLSWPLGDRVQFSGVGVVPLGEEWPLAALASAKLVVVRSPGIVLSVMPAGALAQAREGGGGTEGIAGGLVLADVSLDRGGIAVLGIGGWVAHVWAFGDFEALEAWTYFPGRSFPGPEMNPGMGAFSTLVVQLGQHTKLLAELSYGGGYGSGGFNPGPRDPEFNLGIRFFWDHVAVDLAAVPMMTWETDGRDHNVYGLLPVVSGKF